MKNSYSHRFKDSLSGIKAYELSRLALWLRSSSIIGNEKPDIVHLNMNVPFSCFFMLFVLKIKKIKNIIATVHSTVSPRSRYPFLRRLKTFLCKLLFPVADRFICVSNKSKEEFCRNYGILESKVTVVYNGIKPFINGPYGDREIDQAKEAFGIGTSTKVVGAVARLEEDKGIEFLLKAFSMISKNHKDSVCLVAGEGRDKARFKKLAVLLGIADRVIFPGYVCNKKQIYAAIDIFVLASLHEAFPLTVLEAMHAGKPVIAAAVGGIPELIEDRLSGLLVAPEDSCAIKNAVEFLLENKDKSVKMGSLGRARVNGLFPFDKMIKNTQDVYDSLAFTR